MGGEILVLILAKSKKGQLDLQKITSRFLITLTVFKILISGAFEVQGRFLRSRCQLLKVVVYFWSYWRSFKIKIIHFLKIMVLFKIEVRVLFLKIRHSLFEIKVHFFAWVTFSWSRFCFCAPILLIKPLLSRLFIF